jgi:hypothetical protein
MLQFSLTPPSQELSVALNALGNYLAEYFLLTKKQNNAGCEAMH